MDNYFQKHFKEVELPLIVIYNKPSDFSNKFVARLFNIDKPTKYFMLADTLKDIRKFIPKHMVKFIRDDSDDISIVETYI